MFFSSTWTEQELLDRLQQNTARTVVVTSTVRAARAWRASYARAQKENSRVAWTSPQIVAWEPWLRSLWNAAILSGAEARVLLSAEQELVLWQRILESDETARQTLSYTGLAELAQNAFRELNNYRIPLQQLSADGSMDTKAFHAWSIRLLAECRKLSCLPFAQMESALVEVIGSDKIILPEEVILIGFDRSTPSHQMLMTALRARNCNVHWVALSVGKAATSAPNIVCARTLEEEIACAAQWIRRELLSRPDQRIAVVAPSSVEVRNKIDRTFRTILAPSTMDIRAPASVLPYEFSLGTAMVRLQPVRTALTLLRWLYEPISEEDVSWILVHGGFSSGPLDARATLDRRFRERKFQLGVSVSFRAFRQWILKAEDKSGRQEEFSGLRGTIQALFAIVRNNALDRLRTFSEWRELIEDMLKSAELHLLRPETSEDYQLLQRWSEVLNEFASLNAVAGPVTFSSALEKLEHMANNMLFAQETSYGPVQILGIPESAGLVFDAVWWMGAQASDWPSRGKAQPFLPWDLQRSAHMPYSDPVEDDAFAQRVTRRLLNAASEVSISFAMQNSDLTTASTRAADSEIIFSPLVRQELPGVPMISAEDFNPAPEERSSEKRMTLESVQEEAAVPFLPNHLGGGVRFLELQSACPFRAFAELRLGARPLQERNIGLDAATQGTLIHRVLQQFWAELGSQKNLLRSTSAEHRQILRKYIDAALGEYATYVTEPWQATLLQVEAERMEGRLLLWLDREKNRPDFTVSKTEDTLHNQQLGGIEFDCRLDRLDETDKGNVLLDYKTACVSANDCGGERPDLPQLPAYAVLRNANGAASTTPAGIAFAGLHPQNVDFTIIASQPSVLRRKTGEERETAGSHKTLLSAEEMQDQLANWTRTLTRLAGDFRNGTAIVDPKKGRETCTYCHLAVLCRLAEAEETTAAFNEEDIDLPAEGVHDN
jgi:ATP-dependent helicase/nuclease subunit B